MKGLWGRADERRDCCAMPAVVQGRAQPERGVLEGVVVGEAVLKRLVSLRNALRVQPA